MSNARVLDVALKYGYDSPESFSKAFRKIHGIAPSEAKLSGASLKAFPRISFHLSLKGEKDMDYRIEEKEAFEVVGKSFPVSCVDNEHMREIPKFWAQSHADGTIPKLSAIGDDDRLLAVILDTKPNMEAFNYMIGCAADSAKLDALGEGFSASTVPVATWAIFPCEGALPGSIQGVFARIYQEWFPATGYEHSGAPEIEAYPPGDTTSEDYRCEVWIPIVKK
ncbi:AraC family transcriptional regulator [Cohnella lupini]|uniref:AraC family transcriptional regulator n=1 Tax=Cohnella lupini TaxID=1294267 RepID=A0A3D9I2N3_9BACL|nr:AraC family transcriptional regulator [Cohnella lupini]